MRVPVEVEEAMLEGSNGQPVPGVKVHCTHCGHEVEVFGTGEASIKRGCAMLRAQCPEGAENFYVPPEVTHKVLHRGRRVTVQEVCPVESEPEPEPARSVRGPEMEIRTMYLFYDTETTGVPAGSPNVHMCQLAWLLVDDQGEERSSGDFIVKPAGWTIPEHVAAIHGITTARANIEGVPVDNVLSMFTATAYLADRLVGHNRQFDDDILAAEFQRIGWDNPLLPQKERLCTMRTSAIVAYCGLPAPNRPGQFKWPKLGELYYKLFGENLEGAHNAIVDIRATARCFWRARKLGLI